MRVEVTFEYLAAEIKMILKNTCMFIITILTRHGAAPMAKKCQNRTILKACSYM